MKERGPIKGEKTEKPLKKYLQQALLGGQASRGESGVVDNGGAGNIKLVFDASRATRIGVIEWKVWVGWKKKCVNGKPKHWARGGCGEEPAVHGPAHQGLRKTVKENTPPQTG